MEIKSIIKEYYKQHHANKFDCLDEMGLLLAIYKFPKLTDREIDNQNRAKSIKEFRSVISHFPKEK